MIQRREMTYPRQRKVHTQTLVLLFPIPTPFFTKINPIHLQSPIAHTPHLLIFSPGYLQLELKVPSFDPQAHPQSPLTCTAGGQRPG